MARQTEGGDALDCVDRAGATAIEIEALSAIISTIYDCAVDPACWPAAIEKITRLIDGLFGVMLVIDQENNQVRFQANWNADAELLRSYDAHHADNPLRGPISRLEVGESYNVLTVMQPQQWRRTQLYREFCQPQGWLDSAGVTLTKTPSRLASLAVVRHENVGFAGPRELGILRLFAPHLRKAASIADMIEMREITARTFESSFDALLVPALLVASDGSMLHANAAARELLASGDPVRGKSGVLKASAPAAAQRLEAAIGAMQRQSSGSENASVVYIPFADGRPAFAHLLPINCGAVRSRIEPRAAWAIFITAARESTATSLSAWMSAFGLTAAETRVLELLVNGRSIIEVAEELEVAPTTARTHLARLMQKTGMVRQAELVRLAMQLMPPVREGAPPH